jgi:hypothetical protein
MNSKQSPFIQKRFFVAKILLFALAAQLHAGQLADRVFAYQTWTTLQADSTSEQVGNTLVATTEHVVRNNKGDVALRYENGYDILRSGKHYSMAGGKVMLDGSKASGPGVIARFFSLGPSLKHLAVIDKESGDQLWIHFSDMDPKRQLQITADATGKISLVDSGGLAIENLTYTAFPEGMALTGWTFRYKAPSQSSVLVSILPKAPVMKTAFSLSNVILNADLAGDAFDPK